MNPSVPTPVKAYLRSIGSRGGKRSRRRLDPSAARRMVALREARKAFRRYKTECFWSSPANLLIGNELIPFVIEGLMSEGNRSAFEKARRIKRLIREDTCR